MRTDGWAAVCGLGEGDARGREELDLLWFLAGWLSGCGIFTPSKALRWGQVRGRHLLLSLSCLNNS